MVEPKFRKMIKTKQVESKEENKEESKEENKEEIASEVKNIGEESIDVIKIRQAAILAGKDIKERVEMMKRRIEKLEKQQGIRE